MEKNSSDIDVIELFLFLKNKIMSIILFVIFSLILSSIFFVNKQKQNKCKVRIKYDH